MTIKGEYLSTLVALLFALMAQGCAGGRHYHDIPAEGPPPGAARYLEIERAVSTSTLHFPPGTYSLAAEDDVGYYYRAPRKIVQHTAAQSLHRDGGIYVTKRDPNKMRGYVYFAGARTHVGNLSRVKHEFRE